MTNIAKDFDFKGVDALTLMARYNSLREEASTKGENVDLLVLQEMVAICNALRRHATGNRVPARPRMKAIPTLDDL